MTEMRNYLSSSKIVLDNSLPLLSIVTNQTLVVHFLLKISESKTIELNNNILTRKQ